MHDAQLPPPRRWSSWAGRLLFLALGAGIATAAFYVGRRAAPAPLPGVSEAQARELASAQAREATHALEGALREALTAAQNQMEEGAATHRRDARERVAELTKRMDLLEREHAGFAPREELAALEALARASAEHLAQQEVASQSLRHVHDLYRRGVGLIHGRWTIGSEGEGGFEPVTNRAGQKLEVEYTGTGFYVRADGIVMTNRHVAEPWWENPEIAPLLNRGLKPRFLHLTITFPERDPLPVNTDTVVISDDGVDLAAFRIPPDDLPVLPLSLPDPDLYRGGRVIVLGYPTGVGALMARIERAEARAVLERSNSPTDIIAELAKRHLVTPIVTQGSLNDVRETRIIHDAATTSGGSGGPVFAPDGAVLGVNFAVTRDFGGSNFGVPVEFVRRLLARVALPRAGEAPQPD